MNKPGQARLPSKVPHHGHAAPRGPAWPSQTWKRPRQSSDMIRTIRTNGECSGRSADDPSNALIIGTETIFMCQSELLGGGNSLTISTTDTNGEYSRRSVDEYFGFSG